MTCPGEPIPLSQNELTGAWYPCVPLYDWSDSDGDGIPDVFEPDYLSGLVPGEIDISRYGCTDIHANNFDVMANFDNGSCTYSGCK